MVTENTKNTSVVSKLCIIKAKNFFVHTSISQWKGRSPVWDLRCNFNLDALVNRFSHPSTGHAWGFSPLWVRMWDVKVPGAENTLLHPSISHLKGFRSAWCLLLCTFNLCAVGNVLSQPSYLHMWVSVRKCALTCVFKLYAVVKHLPHPSWVHCQNESHTMFFLSCTCTNKYRFLYMYFMGHFAEWQAGKHEQAVKLTK